MNEEKPDNSYKLWLGAVFLAGVAYLAYEIAEWWAHASLGMHILICSILVLIVAALLWFAHLRLIAPHKHAHKMRIHEHKKAGAELDILRAHADLKRQEVELVAHRIALIHDARIAGASIKVTQEMVEVTAFQPVFNPNVITAPSTLPDKVFMTDVMRRWNLTPDNVFLALGKGNQDLACTLEGFMHVAHDASTGGGKTTQWRAEMVQLLKLDVQVVLANPHFAPITKKGEDWRPIARAIEAQGRIAIGRGASINGLLRKPESIGAMLKWLAQNEIDRRYEMQDRGDFSWKPIYAFIDELPVITERCPDAASYLADVIRRGRAVDVCVDTNSQGFLVNTVKMGSDARENFNTAYCMGGSLVSASALLDMGQKEISTLLLKEQVALGKGIALLRNNEAIPHAQLVRLPYADNAFVYHMLGRADEWVLPQYRAKQTDAPPDMVEGAYTTIEEVPVKKVLPGAFYHVEKESKRSDLYKVYQAHRNLGTLNRRAIAEHTGLSLGKVQAIVQELIVKGHVQE